MHYYSTNLSSIFLVIFVPYFSTALGSVPIFWDTKRYRNLHVECNGAKCGLDPLGKMFQYIWLPRKKVVYWIIVMVYYSNYPRAVHLFCGSPRWWGGDWAWLTQSKFKLQPVLLSPSQLCKKFATWFYSGNISFISQYLNCKICLNTH